MMVTIWHKYGDCQLFSAVKHNHDQHDQHDHEYHDFDHDHTWEVAI